MKNNYQQFINDVINERVQLQIDVFDAQKNKIGYLSPITQSFTHNDEGIEKLTKWRNSAAKNFFTQFTATPDRTLQWLEETVLKDNSRLLFIIYSSSKMIGQYGFRELTAQSVEIDNLIRGEIGGHPKLIYYSEISLLNWLFNIFYPKKIIGHVLANNIIALNLHESVGFKRIELIPLRRIDSQGEVHLKMDPFYNSDSNPVYCWKIELIQPEFTSQENFS